MVSFRCILKVKEELERMGITYLDVILGEATLHETLSQEQTLRLKEELKKSGLELLNDKRCMLTERIKISLIEFLDVSQEIKELKFSSYLEKKLKLNYKYLSNVFSQKTTISISHALLMYKIEKAKELISYNELNMSEIGFRLNFSSLAHFSSTFKRITGVIPSKYNSSQHRICLEELIDHSRVTKTKKSTDLHKIRIKRPKGLNTKSYPLGIVNNSYI